MFSHVHIGVRDFTRAYAFYSALMPVLNWPLKFVETDRQWAGWHPKGQDRPLLIVGVPFDGNPASAGNGQMVAFMAASRDCVDRFYATAMAHGATNEGPPGPRPEYHSLYYGAYVRDPDGNKLCVCNHDGQQNNPE